MYAVQSVERRLMQEVSEESDQDRFRGACSPMPPTTWDHAGKILVLGVLCCSSHELDINSPGDLVYS